MAESILYITFKDTVSNEVTGMNLAVNNLRNQLIAAAERIQSDPNAIYAYLRSDSVFKLPESKPEPEVKQDGLSVAKQMLTQVFKNAQTITATGALPAKEATIPPLLNEDQMIEIIFKDIKKTQKSENILRFLIQNSGAELSVDQLCAGASVSRNDLSSWMATTKRRFPVVTTPSRGVYKFNPDKLNITNEYGKKV